MLAHRAVRGRTRTERETLLALAEAVLAGLVAAGHEDLVAGRVVVEPDPSGRPAGHLAFIDEVADDAATRWADALAEALGPLGTPRWMVAVGERAWRVPTVVGATSAAATAYGRAFGARVPGAKLLRAGEPRATELVLAAARERPDAIGRTLRWR